MTTDQFTWNLRLNAPARPAGGSVPNILMGTATFSRRFLNLLLPILIFASTSYAENIKILKVEANKLGNYAEVSVYTSDNITPKIILLESPNRIAMAFENAKIDSPLTIPGPSSFIRIVQAMQFNENTVYVIVEPKEEMTYEYTSIIGKNKFILELAKAKPDTVKKISPSSAAKEQAEIQVIPETTEIPTEEIIVSEEAQDVTIEVAPKKAAVPVKKKVKPVGLRTTVTTEVIKKPAPQPLLGKVIIIDPGHGGKDPGYVGKYGTLEKFLTYKVSLRLKRMLREAGAKVLLTRYSDVSVKNGKIVEFANAQKADIFIAVHFNSYTSPSTAGCETFYFTPQSKTLAKVIQRNLYKVIGRRNRGVKKDMYYTIHHTTMPAVLVEAIYLTNPKEERLILKPIFQENVAYGIYKGVLEYDKITATWQKYRKSGK